MLIIIARTIMTYHELPHLGIVCHRSRLGCRAMAIFVGQESIILVIGTLMIEQIHVLNLTVKCRDIFCV